MAENGIDIRAISISDTVDFGILRLIVNDPEKCEKVLKENGFTVSITNVIAVGITDERAVWHRYSHWRMKRESTLNMFMHLSAIQRRMPASSCA